MPSYFFFSLEKASSALTPLVLMALQLVQPHKPTNDNVLRYCSVWSSYGMGVSVFYFRLIPFLELYVVAEDVCVYRISGV